MAGGPKGGKGPKVVVVIITAIVTFFTGGPKPTKNAAKQQQQQQKQQQQQQLQQQKQAPLAQAPAPAPKPAPVPIPIPINSPPPPPTQNPPPPTQTQTQTQTQNPTPIQPPPATNQIAANSSSSSSTVTTIQGAAGMSAAMTGLVTQTFQVKDLSDPIETTNYVQTFFDSAAKRGFDTNVGLPGYSYFQGMIIGRGKLDVVGQVRVVGGILAAADSHLQGGAMVTTTPEAQIERVQAVRSRWQVESWVEE